MEIKIYELIEGAKKAEGLTVIIDVFRAFSVTCYLFAAGARQIIPVGDIDLAYKLKEENEDYILIGEREGKIQPGFDYGNSPTRIKDIDFSGKTIVHTTSAGTKGIVNADKAREIITGSFVNAGAIINYILRKQPEKLSLVCMGNAGIKPAREDNYLAYYLKNELQNTNNNFAHIIMDLKESAGGRFFDPKNEWSPRGDFNLCLDLNRFDFVIKAERDSSDGLFRLSKIKG